MRPISNPISRRSLLTVLTMIVASYAANNAAAQSNEPAQVILLGDDTANWLLDLDPRPSPQGQVLVAGNDEGKVFAFVLGRNPGDAEDQLGVVKISGAIDGCEPGDGTCCDAQNKSYVLDSEFEGQRFWLRLGEICQGGPPSYGTADGPPIGETDASVVEVEPGIMSALAAYGVTHPFMTLAEESGNGRILVDPSYESSDLGLSSMKHLVVRDDHPLIIRANHVIQQPDCVTSIAYCKIEDGDRCNGAGRHWWRWNSTRQKWCRMADTCRC